MMGSHHLTKMQKWVRYHAPRIHLEHYEHLGQIVPARTETPIKRVTSLRQSELCVDSRVRRRWCHPKAYRSPTEDRQCTVLPLIFRAPCWTSFDKNRRHFLQNAPIILHDNAWPHTTQAMTHLWGVPSHPPPSPNLSPCDFYLIPKIEEQLHGIRFKLVSENLAAVDRYIRTINRTGAVTGVCDFHFVGNGLYTLLETILKDCKI
ncbi:UNVERIFIED_CONTAM: hypothetical protein NCL1_26916 [Trichonephila clavipes]